MIQKGSLEMWIKGYLVEDADWRHCEVITRTGRRETGELLEANPAYKHDYANSYLSFSKLVNR